MDFMSRKGQRKIDQLMSLAQSGLPAIIYLNTLLRNSTKNKRN